MYSKNNYYANLFLINLNNDFIDKDFFIFLTHYEITFCFYHKILIKFVALLTQNFFKL